MVMEQREIWRALEKTGQFIILKIKGLALRMTLFYLEAGGSRHADSY